MEDQTKQWPYIQELPQAIEEFLLVTTAMRCGTQERCFSYILPGGRRSFSVLYDEATKVFLAKTAVGLSEFCDPQFISDKRENIERILREKLEHVLLQLAGKVAGNFDLGFRKKGILEWRVADELPATIAGFERYICPHQAVRGINGSYIVLDYSDFNRSSNFILFYNVFRDEFFGEFIVDQTPRVTTMFDSKTLPEVEAKLKELLVPELEQLRRVVGG